jgi:DNA polymerase II large subunit
MKKTSLLTATLLISGMAHANVTVLDCSGINRLDQTETYTLVVDMKKKTAESLILNKPGYDNLKFLNKDHELKITDSEIKLTSKVDHTEEEFVKTMIVNRTNARFTYQLTAYNKKTRHPVALTSPSKVSGKCSVTKRNSVNAF